MTTNRKKTLIKNREIVILLQFSGTFLLLINVKYGNFETKITIKTKNSLVLEFYMIVPFK